MQKKDKRGFYYSTDFIAVVFTIFLFLWSYWVIPWHFHVNDDLAFILFPNGGYGGPGSANLVYMSSLLGWPLLWLYKFLPDINWYPLLMYTIIFISIFLIHTHIFMYFQNKLIYIAITILISILYFPIFISEFTYTMVSFLVALSAFIALFFYNPYFSKVNILFYGAWLSLAFLIRNKSFFGAMLVGALFWIFPIIMEKRKVRFFFFVVGIIVCAGLISDYFAYSSTQWKGYLRLEKTFTLLNNPLYPDAISSIMENNRWSENDLKAFREQWWFLNENKFSLESIENAVAINQKYKPSIGKIIINDFLNRMKALQTNYKTYIYSVLFLFTLLCILSYRNWAMVGLQSGLLLLFLCLCIYMESYMKFPFWVAIPIFVFYSFSAIFLHTLLESQQKHTYNHWTAYLSIALILMAIFTIALQVSSLNQITRNRLRSTSIYFNSAIEAINRLPADSILIMHWSFPYEGFPIFSNNIRFSNPSTIILLGWSVRTPYFYTILKQSGFSSGQEFEKYITASSKNIYMFATKPYFDVIQKYMKENYGVDFQREVISTFKNQSGELFKIITSNASNN